MSPRLWLLNGYYQLSRPYRWWWMRRAMAEARAPVMVLFYHRIADDVPNAWTCNWRTFSRQMHWLKRRFDMVTLAEAQRRLREGCDRPCVSITFDDGYDDNYHRALPLLVREQIPCTYFVSTEFVLRGEPFPHDVAAGHPLEPNTLDQLRRMAASGIEIGAHTRTHADLGAIDDDNRLADEVLGSVAQLETALKRPVRYFAFPYGLHSNLNARVFQLAREAGLLGVCSAYGGYNFPGDDAFHLQRIHGDPDMVRLRNWTTVDPRKLRVPRYVDDSAQRAPAPLVAGGVTS